jgi:hypothetical protein
MSETLTIPARFRGPPTSGNGGYVAGKLAALLGDGPAEVSLRAPTPLDTALAVVPDGDGLRLMHGDTLVATAAAKPLTLEMPDLPPLAETEAATKRGGSPDDSAYGQCFVCGRNLPAHLGLRVHTGWLPERRMVAGLWRPDAAFAEPDGTLDPAFAWGALDCPGGFACGNGIASSAMYLTGRMHAEITGTLRAGEPYVVIGWPLTKDGRKTTTGTAVCTTDGAVVAKAISLWIEMKPGF